MISPVRALLVASLAVMGLGQFALAAPVSAASVDLAVTIASDAPLLPGRWSNNIGSTCTYNTGRGPFHYSVERLNVTVRGNYDYQDLRTVAPTIDITVAVYPLGAFDPTNPTTNCLSSSDDSATLDLSSADSFTLVVTAYTSGASGLGAFNLDGPGVASLASPAPASDATPPPPPWLKAYARASALDTCDEGWTPSYAAWPNDGTGGWVCEQTWVYRHGTWAIGASAA